MKRVAALAVAVALGCGAGAASATAMPHPLQLGVAGDPFLSTDAGLRDTWMEKAGEARANLVLLGVGWSGVAPATRPAGFDAADPADPAYDWEALDGGVRSAVARGMQPVLPIDYAPAWAEGPGRPGDLEKAPAGTWMPQPRELGKFARAIATRYSGRFVDPAHPEAGALPRVRYFQVWQEQNLSIHLAPQWRGRKLVGPSEQGSVSCSLSSHVSPFDQRADVCYDSAGLVSVESAQNNFIALASQASQLVAIDPAKMIALEARGPRISACASPL